MRQPLKRLALGLLAVALTAVLAACGGGPAGPAAKPPAAAMSDPFASLAAASDKYLKENRPLTIEAAEVLARAVAGTDRTLYLVDVRADEHYAQAHIPGAIHIAYTDAWREAKIAYLPRDKKIVVIDYSGHSASQVAALWNLLGFDAVAMKHGMGGWSQDKEVIGGSPLACEALGYPVVTAETAAGSYTPPQITTKAAALPELIMSRSKDAGETPPVIQPKDFKDKIKDYYVVDLRQGEHYRAGHIEGAVNIPFRTVAEPANLQKLPPDKSIALVDYDGHAASQAARLLNQLGYSATVLKDGMSVWTADAKVIGAPTVACVAGEKPTMKLNAPLKPGPSTAAT
jgi:rhodanese-related sulfurtransferase